MTVRELVEELERLPRYVWEWPVQIRGPVGARVDLGRMCRERGGTNYLVLQPDHNQEE